MHEAAIATAIIEVVDNCRDSRKLEKLTIDNGVFSGVFADSLIFYLEIILEEKGMKDVAIEVRETPAHCICACGNEYKVSVYIESCPVCGGFDRRITEGKNCVIESIEVADG